MIFPDLFVPELRVTEVYWGLFQLSKGEDRVDKWPVCPRDT